MEDVIRRFLATATSSGYGYGYGYGYGDGSGYGDVKEYNGSRVYMIDGVPTLLRLISLDDEVGMNGFAVGRIVKGDLTTEKTYVAKRGGLFAHGATLEEAIAAVNDKLITTKDVDGRIDSFIDAYPLVDTFVKGEELFRWHNLLTGSCLQGRRGFVEARELDLNAEFTILEFIALTREAFGGNVIKRLEERYRELGGVI